MSANLITGNLFKPIYAYQDADYQAGISGNVTSIMPVGSQMALSIEDANTIKADDGVLITKEGRRIQIDAGAIEEWSIPTGTQGQTNYYIVGFRLYTGDNSAELCETFVEKMENATDTIPEKTFREGSTEVYVSLGRVVQSGINLDSVTSLVQIAQSFEDVRNAIAQLNSDLGSKSSASAVTGDDAFSKIATLNSDLGSKSSASGISGNDAFSKIATLNSDLTVLNRVATAYKRNHLGNPVSLASTDENNQYTFDYDGYVLTKAASGDVYTVLGDSNNVHLEFKTTSGESNLLFVKAGMRYYKSGGTGTLTAVYRPLVDA